MASCNFGRSATENWPVFQDACKVQEFGFIPKKISGQRHLEAESFLARPARPVQQHSTISLLAQTAPPLSVSCMRSFQCGSRAPMCPGRVGSSYGSEVHVNEFDAVAAVLRPLCPTTPVDVEGFIEFRSLWYLGYQYLFSQASSLTLRIVQSSSWDGVELNQRVFNFDESGLWTGQSALRKELYTLSPMTARSVPQSMILDQKVSLSSPGLTSIRDKYMLQWMERTLLMVFAFTLPGYRASCVSIWWKFECARTPPERDDSAGSHLMSAHLG